MLDIHNLAEISKIESITLFTFRKCRKN